MLLKSLRFIAPFAVLCLVIANLLPGAGVTVPGGFGGFVITALLGALLAVLYRGLRYIEGSVAASFANTQSSFEYVWLIAPVVNIGILSAVLGAVSYLCPTYVVVPDLQSALGAAFWLVLFGHVATVPSISRLSNVYGSSELAKSIRFFVPIVGLCFVVAYLLPTHGLKVAAGFAGFVATVALAGLLGLAFRGLRRLEAVLGAKYGRTKHGFEYVWLAAPVANALVLTGVLLLVGYFLPTYVTVAGVKGAAYAAFWLTVFGHALTAPAVSRFNVVLSSLPQPQPEPTTPADAATDPAKESGSLESPKPVADALHDQSSSIGVPPSASPEELLPKYHAIDKKDSGVDAQSNFVGNDTGETLSEEEARKAEERQFVLDLVSRGKAKERDANGHLPPECTHEIVGHEPDGTPIVKRVRTGF